MKNRHLTPWEESLEALSKSAAMGESDALVGLSRIADQEQDDEKIEQAVNAFDDVAVLYAMGGMDDEISEWQKFRQVIDFAGKLWEYEEALEQNRAQERRTRFEIEVLEEAVKSSDDEGVRQRFSEELEITRYSLDFSREEKERLERDISDATLLLRVAKKKLTHSRFTSLPDDVLDELIEVVDYELQDETADDDDEPMEDYLDDECDICRAQKNARLEGNP